MTISQTTTSGSTGTPVSVDHIVQLHNPIQHAIMLRTADWHKIDPQKSLGRFSAKAKDDDEQRLGEPFSWYGPTGTGFARCLKGREYPELYEYCASRSPAYLLSGPQLFVGLARYALREGRRDFRPEKLLSYGSAVTEDIREIVSDGLGTRIIDRYSSEETGMIALQCPTHDHLHVLTPATIVEIVDDNGVPCGTGKPGRILVTNTQSYAMPIIRYEIGDIGEWGEKCDCGINLPVLKSLWGRANQMITTPEGHTRYVKIFHRDFQDLRELLEYRFVLHQNSVVVAQIKATDSNDALTKTITDRVQRLMNYAYPVVVRYVTQIDWGRSWKKENFAVSDEPVLNLS